ncbi:MAG TPA: FAD-dependent monooxygenase [Thermoanaerobaculia bacterium]|jgi:flavin-dependent dehydrogenase|nr:FAD-dependent monooxygenase [Thermoanaerobaculia bacterium]
MTPDRDAIIVGAGPAGSAAAAALAGAGRDVLVLEKDRFPRRKVCGEFLSGSARESLARLDALVGVANEAAPIERGSVHLQNGKTVAFELPAPGFGISRARLDDLLARRAADLGAEVRFGTRVLSVEAAPDGLVRVRAAATGVAEEILTARSIVGAWGRWDALDRTMGRRFLGGRRRFLGWSRDFEGADAAHAREVRLYLFPGGYCGLSRVEHAAEHLAGVISERVRRTLGPGWEAVVAHARRANRDLDRDLSTLREGRDGFLGTGSVFFTAKPPVEGGALMAGDAAGVIDPFSGEGLAGALASGLLAADSIELGLSGRIAMEEVPSAYALAWRRRFAARLGWGAAFRGLMLHPAAASLAARLGGERLVRLALGQLGS